VIDLKKTVKCGKIRQFFKKTYSPERWPLLKSPLPNLFSSLARCFAYCQSCSVSLRTLWAYGFDSTLQRAPEKLRLARKKKIFSFNQLYFLKSRLRSAIKTGESHPERAWS